MQEFHSQQLLATTERDSAPSEGYVQQDVVLGGEADKWTSKRLVE